MNYYWVNQYEEQQMIKYNAFVSAVQILGLMLVEGIKSRKINPIEEKFFYWENDKPKFQTKTSTYSSKKGQLRNLIDKHWKITEVAKKFGLKVKNNMVSCPFGTHEDKEPSLSLSDEKNCFHCFGCNASGDIITFWRLLKNVKR